MSTLPDLPAEAHRFPIVELRQYTLHPERRDDLIALFDREFIEPQEAAGMTVLGEFRDLDDADRFVWLRGFGGMPQRAQALSAFYDGPVWRAHRDAANETMIDSDNVLLLRPAEARGAMPIEAWTRNATLAGEGGLLAVVCPLASAPQPGFVDGFIQTMTAALARRGATLAGCYVSASGANNFPRLPVREREQVLVWLARFDQMESCSRHSAELAGSYPWLEGAANAGAPPLVGPPQVLRLAPTACSRF